MSVACLLGMGLSALLRGLLCVWGGGARSAAVRVCSRCQLVRVLAGLAALLGGLTFAAAPASAETVEKPVAHVPAPLFATQATLHGVLDPGKSGGPFEMGTYEFVYRQSAVACKGAGEVRTAEGLAPGGGGEEVSQAIEGLAPNTEYSVCLVAHNEAKTEEAASATLTFKTAVAVAPEAPATEPPGEVKGDTAVLDGVVNPNITAQVETGTYEFLYKATGTATQAECESAGASKAPVSPGVYAGAGPEPFSEAISGLTQDTDYVVCLAVSNAGGMTVGPAVAFKTGTPEAPTAGEAVPVGGTTATFHGVLNPEHAGEAGTYEFLYNEVSAGSGCEGGHSTPAASATGATPEPVSAAVSGLLAGSEYAVCLRATNASEEAATSTPITFTTTAVGLEDSPAVTQSEAELSAEIGTDNAETTYYVQYGTGSVEESATPTVTLAAASAPVSVEQRLGGLQPATTYHFRFLANNGHGLIVGEERTFTTPAVAAGEAPPSEASCKERYPAQIPRTGFSAGLPDCRAYELVSPTETYGQDATTPYLTPEARASESGEAFTFSSAGVFADSSGATDRNQYLSRRAADGWSTQGITPLYDVSMAVDEFVGFETMTFTPELTAAVANSSARLAPEAPPAALGINDLYVESLDGGVPYRYAGQGQYTMGASTDLSHVVFGEYGTVSEWTDGTVTPVGVDNDGESMPSIVGSQHYPNPLVYWTHEVWRAVSENGSRVYFTTPVEESPTDGTLYLRVNAEQPQSEIANPEANATGTLTSGSEAVTLEPIHAAERYANLTAGSTEVTLYRPLLSDDSPYPFTVGQPISGPGIPAGDKIASVSEKTLTLSSPADASRTEVTVTSERVDAFAVGERISGYGIAAGTTVTHVSGSALTLSAPAGASESSVPLSAGGECTEAGQACTIDVSASQRAVPDDHGLRPARYWGASGDGSKVFFTSSAELTDDAYTGIADNAANLYEYDLTNGKLTDLSVDTADVADGAAVQGIVQVSQDGSYVYFVADGKLAAGATAGQPNLYVIQDGGSPRFIVTLEGSDSTDWGIEGEGQPDQGANSPEGNTAVLTATGTRLAFVSERSLTGYDNRQAQAGDCEGVALNGYAQETGKCREVYLYDAETGGLECASCNPTGARPGGSSSLSSHAQRYLADYRARNLLEDGTLFFESADALVPHASDGRNNVYEYEDGHVYAISDVAGRYESLFLDASANGANVFFATADQLLPEDKSDNVAVYDARVGGGFPVAATTLGCDNGDSCKPPPSAQPAVLTAPPASATFNGPGNLAPPASPAPPVRAKTLTKAQKLAAALRACRKDKRKAKRQGCEKQAQRRYGAAKAKAKARKASNDRRASQ